MKFIKVFADDAAYKAYRKGGSYEMPNVSLSRGTKKVYYNVDANHHEFVDLGLPSGTLWATMNVGASEATDAGLYFQWGDTNGYTKGQVGTGNGQKKFAGDYSDYTLYLSGTEQENNIKFKKYTTSGATLELEDDAANKNWGGDWHMPTPDQIQELIDNTTTAWTTSNGTGVTFTSTANGKSIFIPAAGYAFDGSVKLNGRYGRICSSMLFYGDIYTTRSFNIASGDSFLGTANRANGLSIRGVIG